MNLVSIVLLVGLSMSVEYINAILGMGYGTVMAPLLILLGLDPVLAVFSVLLSQFASDIVFSVFNHYNDNADFRYNSIDTKISVILGLTGGIGSIIGVYLIINLDKVIISLYMSVLLIVLGFLVKKKNHKYTFSMKSIVPLAIFAAFNKTLTGGGYGPIITGGQITLGEKAKTAVVRTAFAGAIVCGIGILQFYLFGVNVDLSYVVPILLGAVIGAIPATFTINKAEEKKLQNLIMFSMFILGIALLLRTLYDFI